MKKYIAFASCLFLLVSCNSNQNKTTLSTEKKEERTTVDSIVKMKTDSSETISKTSPYSDTILLEHITNIPEKFTGCACNLSLNKEAYDRNEFVYVSNINEAMMVRIDGKNVELKQTASRYLDESKTQIVKGENLRYEIDVTKKEVKFIPDESALIEGFLRLKDKNTGVKIIIPLYGVCGC